MKNSPIQIVLNSTDFIEIWDRQGGGEHKDFYENRDKEFVAHQSKLTDQLNSMKEKQIGNKYSEISFAKVVLKQSALAKSHRPTKAIFNRNVAPIVGAGDLGEIFIELNPESIDKITNKIMQSEPETRWKEKVNKDDIIKKVAHPSQLRSEVGAIEEIKPYSSSDKRKFSVEDGLNWISNPQTGGSYIVELFENPPSPQNLDKLSTEKRKLIKSFTDGLVNFGNGLVATKIFDNDKNSPMYFIRLEESKDGAIFNRRPTKSSTKKQDNFNPINIDKRRHSKLLTFLDEHPLVRKITLPPIITRSLSINSGSIGEKHNLPPVLNKTYPKIAIVDGGVSNIMSDWIEDKWGYLSKHDRDEEHGTFIAGLVISGKSLNGKAICKEKDGCKIIDLDILPKDGEWESYYREPLQFFNELDTAVKSLKARTGVRIFNFSLNIEEHVSSDGYSLPAKLLDEIAEENDIVFIISAGNTGPFDDRKEWPVDPIEALKILATSRNDTIKKPAESYRNLSVSALNPPRMTGIQAFALSNYSCRGPGIRIGLKPDLAHIGGSGTKISPMGHGLLSIDTSGNIIDGCGTSYATPNVAKTLASLDHDIEGDVSRESLMGLSIHHAVVPEILMDKKLKGIAKDLVGFGIPSSSDEILEGDEHSITLVFANRIYQGRRMSFNFSWPECLFDAERKKCLGHAKLTIVSTPPFDYKYGAEFVRVNIDGHLRQQKKDGKYIGRLDPLYLPDEKSGMTYEKNQIEHSFKWSPIKVYQKSFPKGVGPSSDWKLEIEYLARDGEEISSMGVPFTALLTISDPFGKEPVFKEMRKTLQAQGIQILDIKTAARIMPRV